MPNWCHNILIVIGPEQQIVEFEAKHAVLIDDPEQRVVYQTLEMYEPTMGKLCIFFDTAWDPGIEKVQDVSKQFPFLTFLLSYFEVLGGFRGRAVITNGEMLEMIHRRYGPDGNELYDLSHPLVDLFENYLRDKSRYDEPARIDESHLASMPEDQRLAMELRLALEPHLRYSGA